MIRHIVTNDAIIIPFKNRPIQVSKEDKSYERVLKVCGDVKSDISALDFLDNNFKYEDDDFSFTYNGSKNEAELFFNGKYYEVPKWFLDDCMWLKKGMNSFRIKYAALFLKKVLSNYNFAYYDLLEKLHKAGFGYNQNGDVILSKTFEQGDVNGDIFYVRRPIENSPEKIMLTLIEVNPGEIINEMGHMYVYEYKVIKSEITITKQKNDERKTYFREILT